VTTAYAEPRFAPLPPTTWAKPAVDWTRIVDQLAQRPGQWAAVAEIGSRQSLGARAIKLRTKGVLTAQRSNGDGTATIWACYVGTDQPAPTTRRTTRWSWGQVVAS